MSTENQKVLQTRIDNLPQGDRDRLNKFLSIKVKPKWWVEAGEEPNKNDRGEANP